MSKLKAYGLAALLSMAMVTTSYACGEETKACCSKSKKEASAKGEKCKKGKKCCKGEKAAADSKGKEKS